MPRITTEQKAAWKSRWGDPPLVPVPSLSGVALSAFLLSTSTYLALSASPWLGSIEFKELLMWFRIVSVPGSLALAYAALVDCPRYGHRSGRGLAWAALALSYPPLIMFAAQVSLLVPSIRILLLGLIALAIIHIPVFASESALAKHLVVLGAISCVLLSLLSCGLLRTREEARRLQCTRNLKELGMTINERQAFRSPDFSAAALIENFYSNFALGGQRPLNGQREADSATRPKWVPVE